MEFKLAFFGEFLPIPIAPQTVQSRARQTQENRLLLRGGIKQALRLLRSHQSRNFPAMVEAGFHSDNHIIMFPAGLCSRRTNGVIRDLPWKKAFVSKSVETQRDVVPIHFGGQNSNFFYNLANVCKRLGIKFNIAMLYLADEMYKNRHKTFRVAIGKPIPWQTFDRSKTPAQWAQYVQDIVYKL